MKQIVFPAGFPYTVEFIRRRCRTVESLTVWQQGAVAIYDVTEGEAPVAYRVISCAQSRPGYEIRSFQGRIWWPVFDGSRALSVDAFVARLDDPNGCFLAAMNLSPSTLYSSRTVTTQRFDQDFSIRHILASSKEDRLALAQEAASRLLVCGGYLYQEGGEPAYFGAPSDECGTASLRIGGLRLGRNQPGDRWQLGLSASQRRRAAFRSNVFHIEDADEACSVLKSEGFRPAFEEIATVISSAPRKMEAAEFCADAVARAILSPAGRLSSDYYATMMTFSAFANSDDPIPVHIFREIVREALAVVSPSDFRKCFGMAQDWARNVMARVDSRFPPPTLSPDEAEMLFQMGASPTGKLPTARYA
jgi:hypothetical protein